jgi:hypothetical protein
MQFLSSTNVFEGAVQLNQAPSQDSHAITRGFLKANSVVGIAADSANYAELVTESGELKLKLKPLTITDVSVDTVAASLSAWVSANYTNGDEKQEGDIIILTAVSGRAQTWIHNGGQAGDVTDFTEIEGQSVSDAEVRAALSASAGVNYNAATGEITADQAEIKGFFGAGYGLAYDGANGVFSLDVDSDGISEGVSNLYFTEARAQAAISVGLGLSYVGGQIDLDASTDDITEGTNLFFTNARAQAAISVTGTGLSYSGGVLDLVASTDDISEGTKLYFTQARARQSVQADPANGNLLKYYNASGDIAVMKSDVFAAFSAGTGMSFSNGQFSFIGTTSIVSEGTNLYFTQARARQSVQADPAAGNLLTFNQSTGDMLVPMSKFRKSFVPQSLTANTWATLQHNLGVKQVHVSAYDVSGNLVQLDVQLIDNNNLKVKSTINVTNAEIVISI